VKIRLLQIDKTQEPWLAQGIETYAGRLGNYTRIEIHTINVPKDLRQRSFDEQKEGEAKLILKELNATDHLVLLDETGKQLNSVEFSKFLSAKQSASVKQLVFLIGGPFGFASKVYERANEKISLSRMTFSHQMVRVFFLEQLYRAFTILKGEKYHHA
jgi:23S rRNA (pseudouridine1915-N3)-methyltransferase